MYTHLTISNFNFQFSIWMNTLVWYFMFPFSHSNITVPVQVILQYLYCTQYCIPEFIINWKFPNWSNLLRIFSRENGISRNLGISPTESLRGHETLGEGRALVQLRARRQAFWQECCYLWRNDPPTWNGPHWRVPSTTASRNFEFSRSGEFSRIWTAPDLYGFQKQFWKHTIVPVFSFCS
jgi:hypothetical protein